MSTSINCREVFTSAVEENETLPKPTSPVSFRVTKKQRLRLIDDAGRMPRGAYIRWKLFEEQPKRGRITKETHIDYEAIARLTAKLGQTRLPQNVNQLSKAANMGALIVDDAVKAELSQACADIASMRQALLSALNMKTGA